MSLRKYLCFKVVQISAILMGTQAVDLVDKIAGEEKHTEEDIGRLGEILF